MAEKKSEVKPDAKALKARAKACAKDLSAAIEAEEKAFAAAQTGSQLERVAHYETLGVLSVAIRDNREASAAVTPKKPAEGETGGE